MKKLTIILCIILITIPLIPVPVEMKDGGTVHYDAILYDIYDVHSITPIAVIPEDPPTEITYSEGFIISILGITVFNNTSPRLPDS